jgi:hypothetical protein
MTSTIDASFGPEMLHPPRTNRVAVVVVHGIGRQQPMHTLRGFVRSYQSHRQAGADGTGASVYAIPDVCDETFELHSYVVQADETRRQVDFYEGYWAQAIQGTRRADLFAWGRRLLLRKPSTLPERIRWIWYAFWGAAVAAAVLLGWFVASGWANGWTDGWWWQSLKVVGVLAGGVGASWSLNVLGDAPRYFDARPENIAGRFAVRNSLVHLLDTLHRTGRYEQIVVVGHSLGSVVAYDCLRILWARRLRDIDASGIVGPDQPTFFAALAGRRMPAERDPQRAGEPLWLISDLITVGSPIAHVDPLMTHDVPLRNLIEERELPTCPPQLVDATPGRYTFTTLAAPHAGEERLHHGAMFSAVRWRNIYAARDFVGGPVPLCLGDGIVNIELTDDWARSPSSHTRYWRADNSRLWTELDGIVGR